jgi:hypothetical protein
LRLSAMRRGPERSIEFASAAVRPHNTFANVTDACLNSGARNRQSGRQQPHAALLKAKGMPSDRQAAVIRSGTMGSADLALVAMDRRGEPSRRRGVNLAAANRQQAYGRSEDVR